MLRPRTYTEYPQVIHNFIHIFQFFAHIFMNSTRIFDPKNPNVDNFVDKSCITLSARIQALRGCLTVGKFRIRRHACESHVRRRSYESFPLPRRPRGTPDGGLDGSPEKAGRPGVRSRKPLDVGTGRRILPQAANRARRPCAAMVGKRIAPELARSDGGPSRHFPVAMRNVPLTFANVRLMSCSS